MVSVWFYGYMVTCEPAFHFNVTWLWQTKVQNTNLQVSSSHLKSAHWHCYPWLQMETIVLQPKNSCKTPAKSHDNTLHHNTLLTYAGDKVFLWRAQKCRKCTFIDHMDNFLLAKKSRIYSKSFKMFNGYICLSVCFVYQHCQYSSFNAS